MGLNADLGPGDVAIDAAVLIYFIEDHPRFGPVVQSLFEQAAEGARSLVTSALTLLEVLVVPYRAGDFALASRYESLLTRSRGLRLVDVDQSALRGAAQLRAVLGLRTPDALQIAAALSQRCKVFVTNDRRLPTVPGLRILQLQDYSGRAA